MSEFVCAGMTISPLSSRYDNNSSARKSMTIICECLIYSCPVAELHAHCWAGWAGHTDEKSCGLVFQGPEVKKKLVYKLQKAGRPRPIRPCHSSASAHVHSLIYYQNVFTLTNINYGLYDFLWIEPTNDLA